MSKIGFIILADGALDQVVQTKDQMISEKRWLKSKGFAVKVIQCPWEDVDNTIDKLGV